MIVSETLNLNANPRGIQRRFTYQYDRTLTIVRHLLFVFRVYGPRQLITD